MKLNNLVVVKVKPSQITLAAKRAYDSSYKPSDDESESVLGIVQDIIVSELEGKTFVISGQRIKESDVLGFKLLVE